MFALFFSLYNAMFRGTWYSYSLSTIQSTIKPVLNKVGEFITSIFGDFQVTDLGEVLATDYINLVSFILALITSIGIVVMAVKGIKKVFGIFFYGVK